jgi:ribosomal protein S18 acetylase RimI-like enzyme
VEFKTVILDKTHLKEDFFCGKPLLDNYLKFQANQDFKKRASVCYVKTIGDSKEVVGYYTLSNSTIPLEFLPDAKRKKFPQSYIQIPATLLGRLAVDSRFRGQGFGEELLVEALIRAYEISQIIGSYAVIVDPIDIEAEKFYEKYGFLKIPTTGKMFIEMSQIAEFDI